MSNFNKLSNKSTTNTVTISKETINRLISDIKNIKQDPLETDGIYYRHSEDDLLKGYALIIGPKDTPYQNGYYFFEFNFPNNYPHSPPNVLFRTGDGTTRFNPNLYRDGKVCLSILNTWKGEGWTACLTLRTILLTLQTVLNSEPLLNEPGIDEKHKDFKNYNYAISYKNIEYSILYQLTHNIKHFEHFEQFRDIIVSKFIENYTEIKDALKKLENNKNTLVVTSIYKINFTTDFPSLKRKLKNLYAELSDTLSDIRPDISSANNLIIN